MFNRFKLHTGFVLIFSAFLVLISILFFFYINNYVLIAYKDSIVKNTNQLNEKILQQVDLYFSNFNQLSKNSVTNPNLLDVMRELDNMPSEMTDYENLLFDREFENYAPYLTNFTSISNAKVYIFGRKNQFKFVYGSLPTESNFEQIYKKALSRNQLDNQRVAFYFHNANTISDNLPPSISIIRPFNDISGDVLGYIEFQQDYSILKNICKMNDSSQVFILDANGHVVYPTSKVDSSELKNIHIGINHSGEGVHKGNSFYNSYTSSENGFTIVIKHPYNTLFHPVYVLQMTTLAIIIIISVVSVCLVYLTTYKMTESVSKLRAFILNIDFENFSLFTQQKSYSNELNLFHDAFQSMLQRLKTSMSSEMHYREREMKARYAALQAQISPHFIHNALFLISISAQEGNIEETTEICQRLSNMLRYTASSSFNLVSLEEEITYIQHYLTLIQIKYEDLFTYQINIQEEAKSIMLPRLTIQPFIENAVQHAFNDIEPPWMIAINASVSETEWIIQILDNGSGIPDEMKAKIEKQLEELTQDQENHQEQINNFEIGGMGILNTIYRLKIKYGNTLSIRIDRADEGENGTIIELKGSIL